VPREKTIKSSLLVSEKRVRGALTISVVELEPIEHISEQFELGVSEEPTPGRAVVDGSLERADAMHEHYILDV